MIFKTCNVNEYKFSTRYTSNSGVVVKGALHENTPADNYYGHLQEIVKLIYQGCNHVYLFKYVWFDSVRNGMVIDRNRIVTIDMNSRLKSNEIFF